MMTLRVSKKRKMASLFILAVLLVTACKCDESQEEIATPQEMPIEEDPNNVYVSPQVKGDVCYLAEHFDSGNINVFKSRWKKSEAKKEDVDEDIAKYDGEWNIEAAVENALNGDLALVLKSKAKHHAVSAFLDRPFRFSAKTPLIIQYDVRFQEGMECGGAYIKLLSEQQSPGLHLEQFQDKTPYTIMFGPDKCGNEFKLHFIFRYENPKTKVTEEKHMSLDSADAFKHIFTDKFSHLLTLTLEPDSRFELSLDQTVIKSGSLLNDFKPPVIPPMEIDDPDDKKPEDWDDRAKIPDPEAKKPEDWDENEPEKIPDPEAVKPDAWLDDEPTYIPDPHAEKPADWDVELDGEWEAPLIENPRCQPGCGEWKAPMIVNPKFKGKWHAPQIENPNYKGIWTPRKIPNPEHFDDPNPFQNLAPISAIGLELWSMSNNIMFDNFLITSDSEVATQFAAETWLKKKTKERSGFASSDSVIDYLYKSANQNSWLWIVYALAIVLPITCCVSYVLSKPKSKKKKHRPQPSSTGGEEHDRNAASATRDQLEAPEDERSKGDHVSAAEKKATKSEVGGSFSGKGDLETVEDNEDEEEEEEEEAEGDDLEPEGEGEADEDGLQSGDELVSEEDGDANGSSRANASVDEPAQPRKRRSRKD